MVVAKLSTAVARSVRSLWATALCRDDATAGERRAASIDVLEPRCLLSAALDLIGVNALRADPNFAGIDGSGVSVAVIDTGVDFSHPLLSASRVAAHDFVRNNDQATPTAEHGTHVAGIIGARDPDIGVATGVGLIGLQVFTPSSSGDPGASNSDIESALQWVLDNRVQYNIVAVNMSLGGGANYTSAAQASSDILYDDVKRLEAAGVTVVSAAGNSYADLQKAGSSAPAVFSTVDVGAVYETNEGRVSGGGGTDYTTAADRVTFFSQRPNTANELFAPGAFITSTVPGGGLKDLAGTSMAAPMVAGVVALMQDAAQTYGGRKLSPTEVTSILDQTADSIVDGDDEDTSVKTTGGTYLRVNAYKAVQFIRNEFGGTSPTPGGTDPNGTLASAIAGPTLNGDPVAGFDATIGADGTTDTGAADVDLYRFVVTSPGNVTVTVASSAFQPYLRLFNSAGTEVGNNTPSGPGTATLTLPLTAGTYYAGVSGAPNTGYSPTVAASGVAGGTGAYTLDFAQAANTDVDGVITAATPINLTSGNVPQALNVSLGTDGTRNVGGADVDFFQVTAPDDGFLLVDIDTLTSPVADTYVRVFDAAGNPVSGGTSDDDLAIDITGDFVEFDPVPGTGHLGDAVTDAAGNPAGHDTDSFVAPAVTRGGVYYVAVCNFANRAFSPTSLDGRVSTGSTGDYSLFVSLRNRDVNGAIPQAVNTTALPLVKNPGTIGFDGTPEGGVEVGDRDVDFIRLNSPTAGILQVDIDSTAKASSGVTTPVDTVLRLFDANGTLLATSDDPDGGLDPLLRYSIAANTDYFAAVSGYGNNRFDPFILGSGGSGATGDYEFSASVLPQAQALAFSDDSAAGGEVQALTLGKSITADIGDDDGFVRGDTDVDIYTFTAPFTGEFTFTAGASDDFGVDTYLRLFNADGTQVAFDDNGQGGTGGSKIVQSLVGGTKYLVGVSGAGANAGAYDPVTGDNAGSGSTGGYVVEATAGTRTLTFGGKTKAVYADADGSTVTITLKGPGTGTVFFDGDGNVDASAVVLDGTTAASSVTVKGDTAIGGVSVTGSLKAWAGKTADLTGDFTSTAGVRSVQFRGVSDADVSIGAGDPLSFVAVDVFDATLTAASDIRSIKVNTWSDNGGADDAISAATVGSVSSKGDFGASIAAAVIGKVKVGGNLGGDVRSGGDIASVSAASIGTDVSVFAGVADGFVGLPDSADDFVNAAAVLKSFAVKGKFSGAFASGAKVAAPTIKKAALGNAATENGGAVFGVAAELISSVSGLFDGSEKFGLKKLIDPTQAITRTDLTIRIV